MNTWLKMDGTRVVGVLRTDEDSLGAPWVLSQTGWDKCLQPPHAYMVPHVVNGVREWRDSRSVAEAKVTKLSELRNAREAALNSTFIWDGSVFDADQVSQTRLMGLYVDSQTPGFSSQPWRLADNSWRVLDATAAAGVWAALKNHMSYQFSKFASLETTLNLVGTDTLAKVDVILW